MSLPSFLPPEREGEAVHATPGRSQRWAGCNGGEQYE